MEWSFSDVPLNALFRPKWAQNEIRRIDWVNMQYGQLTPAGLVPAVYIGGQPWTVDQLPNAFDYGWDGVTWHECSGPVIRPALKERIKNCDHKWEEGLVTLGSRSNTVYKGTERETTENYYVREQKRTCVKCNLKQVRESRDPRKELSDWYTIEPVEVKP